MFVSSRFIKSVVFVDHLNYIIVVLYNDHLLDIGRQIELRAFEVTLGKNSGSAGQNVDPICVMPVTKQDLQRILSVSQCVTICDN